MGHYFNADRIFAGAHQHDRQRSFKTGQPGSYTLFGLVKAGCIAAVINIMGILVYGAKRLCRALAAHIAMTQKSVLRQTYAAFKA